MAETEHSSLDRPATEEDVPALLWLVKVELKNKTLWVATIKIMTVQSSVELNSAIY